MRLWRQALKLSAAAATSDMALRALTLVLLLATGGSAIAFPGSREILIGFTAAMVGALLTAVLKVALENRDENYVIRRRAVRMRIRDDGRKVDYAVAMTIQARVPNLRACHMRLAWSGETDIADPSVWTAIGDGHTVTADRKRAFVNFSFEFDQPLRRREIRRLELRLVMSEPQRQYSTMVTFDPRAYAWSLLARSSMTLTWDATQPVNVDSIYGRTYRSGWDRHLETTAAKETWTPRELKNVMEDGSRGRRWTVWPVRTDRWYILQFRLRPAVDFALSLPAQRTTADQPEAVGDGHE